MTLGKVQTLEQRFQRHVAREVARLKKLEKAKEKQ